MIPKLLKDLESLADDCLKMQADHLDSNIKFTDDNVINALIIFNAITGNILIHRMQEKKTSLKAGCNVAEGYGERLRELMINYVGLDPHEYFSRKKT